jgi:ABC-type iron transport system FetAB ATPase subunit
MLEKEIIEILTSEKDKTIIVNGKPLTVYKCDSFKENVLYCCYMPSKKIAYFGITNDFPRRDLKLILQN